jgi:hypothetical protein
LSPAPAREAAAAVLLGADPCSASEVPDPDHVAAMVAIGMDVWEVRVRRLRGTCRMLCRFRGVYLEPQQPECCSTLPL